MSTSDLEPVLREAQRRAILSVLRGHPEWTLGHVFSHLERDGPRAPLLRDLTLGELFQEPRWDPLRLADDGGPPIDPRRLHAARQSRGAEYDRHVRDVLEQTGLVGAAYLRARVGGPRWKLLAALRRLLEAGVIERSGSTSATRYQIVDERRHG